MKQQSTDQNQSPQSQTSSIIPTKVKNYFWNYVFQPQGLLGYGFSFVAGYLYYKRANQRNLLKLYLFSYVASIPVYVSVRKTRLWYISKQSQDPSSHK